MVKKLSLRLLKINILLLLTAGGFAQEWQREDSISLGQFPSAYTSDFQGNLYFGFSDGRLLKYDPSGQLLENFSLNNNSAISLIDVQNNLKPFLFYFDNQQITILDRFSSVPKDYFISDLNHDIAMTACPSPDGDFWIVENNPQRLRKVNPLRNITILDVQVSLGDSISGIQAYQNIVTITNENGLLIFDQFGALIHALELDHLINAQLIHEKLYAFTNTHILKINPFDGETEFKIERPVKEGFMIKSKDRYALVKEDKLIFYSLR